MSITFKNGVDILLWTLPKLLVTFEERRYLFAAQCIWWIAALVHLDPALRYFIETWKFPPEEIDVSEISESPRPPIEKEFSPTPTYIQWQSESDNYKIPVRDQYQANPPRWTQTGRIIPVPKTQKQLKAERKWVDFLWKRLSPWKDWISYKTRKAENSGSYKNLEITCIPNIALHLNSSWLPFSWKRRKH